MSATPVTNRKRSRSREKPPSTEEADANGGTPMATRPLCSHRVDPIAVAKTVLETWRTVAPSAMVQSGTSSVAAGVCVTGVPGLPTAMTCVALGVGTRCVGFRNRKCSALCLADLHAEVLARRAFVGFLLKEVQRCDAASRRREERGNDPADPVTMPPPMFEFSEWTAADGRGRHGPPYEPASPDMPVLRVPRLRAGITFHMFVTHPPCGDAALLPLGDDDVDINNSGGRDDCNEGEVGGDGRVRGGETENWSDGDDCGGMRRKSSDERVPSASVARPPTSRLASFTGGRRVVAPHGAEGISPPAHVDVVEGHFISRHANGRDDGELKVARVKPGKGEPSLCMSCSDKLVKWHVLGLAGAVAGLVIPTSAARLTSITVAGPSDVALARRPPRLPSTDCSSVGVDDGSVHEETASSGPLYLALRRAIVERSAAAMATVHRGGLLSPLPTAHTDVGVYVVPRPTLGSLLPAAFEHRTCEKGDEAMLGSSATLPVAFAWSAHDEASAKGAPSELIINARDGTLVGVTHNTIAGWEAAFAVPTEQRQPRANVVVEERPGRRLTLPDIAASARAQTREAKATAVLLRAVFDDPRAPQAKMDGRAGGEAPPPRAAAGSPAAIKTRGLDLVIKASSVCRWSLAVEVVRCLRLGLCAIPVPNRVAPSPPGASSAAMEPPLPAEADVDDDDPRVVTTVRNVRILMSRLQRAADSHFRSLAEYGRVGGSETGPPPSFVDQGLRVDGAADAKGARPITYRELKSLNAPYANAWQALRRACRDAGTPPFDNWVVKPPSAPVDFVVIPGSRADIV